MAAKFDPYHRWLAIPPEEQPPNFYRLLGVKMFETDEDVISAAVDQRMMHLRSFQTGPHATDSQRLLNEVAQASRTLLDPDDRRRYDQELKAGLAGRRPGLGTATVFPESGAMAVDLAGKVAKLADESSDLTLLVEDLTVASVQEVKSPPSKPSVAKPQVADDLPDLSADLYELDAPAPQPAAAKVSSTLARPATTASSAPLVARRVASPEPAAQRIHPAIWAAAAGAAALVLLLALAALFPAVDVLGLFHSSDEQPPIARSNGAGEQAKDGARSSIPLAPPRDKTKATPKPKTGTNEKPVPNEKEKPSESPLKKDAPPPQVDQKAPPDKIEKDPSVPPNPPVAKVELKFPTHLELPPVKDAAPVLLGTVPQDVMITSVRLFSQAARLDEDEYFTCDAEQTMDVPMKWRVHIARLNADDRARPPLAEINREGEALRFRWLADAATEAKAAQLSNSMLQIDTTDTSRRVFLRKLETPEPIALDLSQPTIRRELKLANLPRSDNLFLQIGGLAALPVTAKMSDDVNEGSERQSLVVLFPAPTKEQKPEVRVAFELAGVDKVVLTGKPVLVTPQGEAHWSPDRLAAHKTAAAKEMDDAKRKVKMKEIDLTAKRKEQDKLRKKLNTAKGIEKTRAENAKYDVEREIETGLNARDELRKQADTWKQVIDTFPELEKMTKAVHGAAKLEFRLFARTPDADIELARTPNFR
jgi:hypothetical protein